MGCFRLRCNFVPGPSIPLSRAKLLDLRRADFFVSANGDRFYL